MTIYVVVENDFEYNDEVWYQPEGEGYTCVEGFKNKKNADDRCKELNEKKEKSQGKLLLNYHHEDDPDAEFGIRYKVVPLEIKEEEL